MSFAYLVTFFNKNVQELMGKAYFNFINTKTFYLLI